jgi:A/G-specific adenine glycosylase
LYNTNNKLILKWYAQNKRDLPWRQTSDPYKIWLSEVMLQQTQVETVIPYYEKWLKHYPTIKSVALENIDNLLKIWEGLGYYSRCRNFHEAINDILKNHYGVIPRQIEIFKKLKGVGDYISGAVMSIAFNQTHIAVDGNHRRVIARVLGIKNRTPRNIKRIKTYLTKLVREGKPGIINQALMDMGSTICRPNSVICGHCPFHFSCKAFQSGNPIAFPQKIAKKKIPTKHLVAALVYHGDNILISKRPLKGLLGGLWELPNIEIVNGAKAEDLLKNKLENRYGFNIKVGQKLGVIYHAFTHFKMNVSLYNCQIKNHSSSPPTAKWVAFSDLNQYAFSKANHKLFQLAELRND